MLAAAEILRAQRKYRVAFLLSATFHVAALDSVPVIAIVRLMMLRLTLLLLICSSAAPCIATAIRTSHICAFRSFARSGTVYMCSDGLSVLLIATAPAWNRTFTFQVAHSIRPSTSLCQYHNIIDPGATAGN